MTINRSGIPVLSGLVLGSALLAAMVACSKEAPVDVVVAPPTAAVVAQNDAAPTTVVVQDDYVYYPSYEVYYSSNRHEYRYREGREWVTRSAPPGVSVNVLFASPSVQMDFHDTPERHHDAVVRSYPKNWAPPGKSHGAKDDRKDDGKADDKRHN